VEERRESVGGRIATTARLAHHVHTPNRGGLPALRATATAMSASLWVFRVTSLCSLTLRNCIEIILLY